MRTIELANLALKENLLGKGYHYPMKEARSGDVQGSSEEANVRQCISLITDSVNGEWPMSEHVGTRSAAMLFDDAQAVADVLPVQYAQAISSLERRVKDVQCSAEVVDLRTVKLRVRWRYLSTGVSDKLDLTKTLER